MKRQHKIGTRWEYKFLHEADYDELINVLNTLGSNGFEVIKITEYWERHIQEDATLYINVWLKRPIALNVVGRTTGRVRKDA